MAFKKRLLPNYKKVLKNIFRTNSLYLKQKKKIVFKSSANSMVHIEKLEKEIKNKDQILNHPFVSLENLNSYFHRNMVTNNTVTLSGLGTLSQINWTDKSMKKGFYINKYNEVIKPQVNEDNNDEDDNIGNTNIISDYVEASSPVANN